MSYFDGMQRLPGLPVGRAAYSDRMAYIGAELSRLVYEPFTPDASLTEILHKLGSASSDSERRAVLAEWSSHLQSNSCKFSEGIGGILKQYNFEPINFYDVSETQALLARMDDSSGQQILILCFRGTEMKPRDIATDLNFALTPYGSFGRVHSGFKQAFENIRELIENDLRQQPKLPLYTFGHSLGGALALICTKELNPQGDGATYVYGTPRTGDRLYFSKVKTPIYRLEIGGDPVPLIPFGYGGSILLGVLCFFLPQRLSRWLRDKALGFFHTGFRVFIKYAANTPDANNFGFRNMTVEKSAEYYWRVICIWWAWARSFPNFKAIGAYHSIKLYSDMLKAYMFRRNLDQLLGADVSAITRPKAARRPQAAPKTEREGA
ncbi:lipase family protein [Microbulbifer marinus]|uniref:Lipase (Class 3) n=1 Tax=Microbulbifer marinus TaxID=658218 RepID=A0A1H4ALG6_9GAMM|nr:lipase family protein [Microbulbifer marinus]SEA36770.1 Lipase (class 3) [Microbulbifer marinus]